MIKADTTKAETAKADATKRETFIPVGSQYYRAPTPARGEWRRDLTDLRDRGFNTIKIWAVWRWNHVEPDRCDFSDIDELMHIAQDLGLRVVINTIFDAAPAWFFAAHPDARMVTRGGRAVGPQTTAARQTGGVPGPCFHSPEGRQAMAFFLHAIAERYANHPALYTWDLWNEPEINGGIRELRQAGQDPKYHNELVCYCHNSQAEFRQWLARKYGDIEALNRAWARRYRSWDEVETPTATDTFLDMLDWRMFFVDTMTEQMRFRKEIVRQHDQRTPIMCHVVTLPYWNLVGCAADEWQLAAECDVFGCTSGRNVFAHDFTRSAARGKEVWTAEIHAINGMTLRPATPASFAKMKAHMLAPFARGMKGLLFWQYRPELIGTESPAWGLTRSDGSPAPWLEHASRIARVIEREKAFLKVAHHRPADVAILYHPPMQVFSWCATGSIEAYASALRGMHGALFAANLSIDFLHSGDIDLLQQYKAIVIPFPYSLPQHLFAPLAEWVKAGGLLIAEGAFGTLEEETGLHRQTIPPGIMQEVFGSTEGIVAPPAFHGELCLEDLGSGASAGFGPIPAHYLAQELVPGSATAIGHFADGAVAATRHQYGAGQAIAIGAFLGLAYQKQPNPVIPAALLAMLAPALAADRLQVSGDANVRADLLTAEGFAEAWLILQNMDEKTQAEVTITVPGQWQPIAEDVVSGQPFGQLRVEPHAAVLQVKMEADGVEAIRLRH